MLLRKNVYSLEKKDYSTEGFFFLKRGEIYLKKDENSDTKFSYKFT